MVLKVVPAVYGLSCFFYAAVVTVADLVADVDAALKVDAVASSGSSFFFSAAVAMVADSASAVVAAKIP